MFSATGRFTTFAAGAAVLLVVSGAFFMVFDLNTVLGSSPRLPILRIGQEDLPLQGGEDGPAIEGMTSAVGAVVETGAQQGSSAGEGQSVTSTSDTGGDASQAVAQSDDSEREYVEEEVQVDNGRRPDPKSEHPGLGVGLTKKTK